MTVQPQYPAYPQQAYPAQPSQHFPGYPAQPSYPQQAYPAQPQPQQPPAQPLAAGSLDEFYSQPSAGGGPSISWDQKPVGHTYSGVLARDVTSADIQQQTNFQTKAPEFFKDGRPKFVMKLPLVVQPSQEFPEGEATLFVRGRMRDELVRAMSEAGVDGAPKRGDVIHVTLSGKRQTGQGLNPANVFAIQYMPANAPAQGQPAQQVVTEPQQPLQVAQPQPAQQPVQQAPAAQPAPVQQPAAQAPVQQAPQSPQPPADMSAEQKELLARLTGQGQ